MNRTVTEDLLNVISERGEMPAQEFLKAVPRKRGDYLDFYPAAVLLHAGYVSTDSTTESGGERVKGKLGLNTYDTAVFLCQLMLKPGESFKINDCPRDSAHNFPLKVFITSEGFLRLDELAERRAERVQKRVDYGIALSVAIVAALLSSYLTHLFASERLRLEGGQHDSNATAGTLRSTSQQTAPAVGSPLVSHPPVAPPIEQRASGPSTSSAPPRGTVSAPVR
jgi:hypothetical protein